MVSLPNEAQFPYENLDRLVRVKMRPRGMSTFYQISDFVYDIAKGPNPISMDIAVALDPSEPKKIGLFTGASSPDHYPNGENDGPCFWINGGIHGDEPEGAITCALLRKIINPDEG